MNSLLFLIVVFVLIIVLSLTTQEHYQQKDDTNSKYIEKPCETQSIEDEGYSRTTGKQQCNVEPDTNYYGNTYVSKNANDYQQCCQMCITDGNRCQNWTFNKMDKICHLKHTVGTPSKCKYRISGNPSKVQSQPPYQQPQSQQPPYQQPPYQQPPSQQPFQPTSSTISQPTSSSSIQSLEVNYETEPCTCDSKSSINVQSVQSPKSVQPVPVQPVPVQPIQKYKKTQGACRPSQGSRANPSFQGKGYRTIEECRTLCDNDNKCVGFDYARPRGDKYDCYLHYTNPPIAGLEIPGCSKSDNCWCEVKNDFKSEVKSNSNYRKTQGACRPSQGSRANPSFQGKGYRTIEECRTLCDNDNKCVGFDYARPRGDKYDCYLHYTNPPIAGLEIPGCSKSDNCWCEVKNA